MIYTIREFQSYAIAASDGSLGSVTDIYFDEREWVVRYFVVETGSWLEGRRVLLSASKLTAFPSAEWLAIDATREQVRHSPSLDTELPVSRQVEQAVYDHYNWPYYWETASRSGSCRAPRDEETVSMGSIREVGGGRSCSASTIAVAEERGRAQDDPKLRSVREVRGYSISARDGAIGRVTEFFVDEKTWEVRAVAANTREWLSGQSVFIPVPSAEALRWCGTDIIVDATLEKIKNAPGFKRRELSTQGSTDRLHVHRELGVRS